MVLLGLCVLVLLSHYLDRMHTENVKNSISTMYEDRLIVEGYILNMTKNIYQVRETLQEGKSGTDAAVTARMDNFRALYEVFIRTRLTKAEKQTSIDLWREFLRFEMMLKTGEKITSAQSDKVLDLLGNLSMIQLDESKKIMQKVESQYASIKSTSQFAFAIVVVILVVLQILVFSGESLIPLFKPKDPSLN